MEFEQICEGIIPIQGKFLTFVWTSQLKRLTLRLLLRCETSRNWRTRLLRGACDACIIAKSLNRILTGRLGLWFFKPCLEFSDVFARGFCNRSRQSLIKFVHRLKGKPKNSVRRHLPPVGTWLSRMRIQTGAEGASEKWYPLFVGARLRQSKVTPPPGVGGCQSVFT